MIPIAKPNINEEEKNAVMEVLSSGMLAAGKVVNTFGEEFAAYIGAAHCVMTNSGTSALEVALRALGIGPGDKVLTTPFSFIASTNAILYCGATPVFADIDEETFNILPDAIEEALKKDPSIKTLLIVHLFGLPCDMSRIMQLVDRYQLTLIEDCAQAHGAEWNGQKVGTFGKAGCFSFYPTKNMTTGEGGAIVTNDPQIAARSRLLINHGMEVRYHHDIIGHNYRMTNINAAIGLVQLKKLDRANALRRANAAYYEVYLNHPDMILPSSLNPALPVYHQYTLRVLHGQRDQLVETLQSNEIGFGIFYPLTIPEQRCYQGMALNGSWSTADKVKNEVVSIPVHPALSRADLETVVNTINHFKGSSRES